MGAGCAQHSGSAPTATIALAACDARLGADRNVFLSRTRHHRRVGCNSEVALVACVPRRFASGEHGQGCAVWAEWARLWNGHVGSNAGFAMAPGAELSLLAPGCLLVSINLAILCWTLLG